MTEEDLAARLFALAEGDLIRVTFAEAIRHAGDEFTEAEFVVEDVDGPEPDDDLLSPFTESFGIQGHRTTGASDGEIEGWRISLNKSGNWQKPRIEGYYYGPDPANPDDDFHDYHNTHPVVVNAIEVLSPESQED